MKPGRELDALIAEKIFGYEVCKNPKGGWSIGPADYYDDHGCLELSNPLPPYSQDIASAWEVVEKLKTVNPDIFHLSRALRLTLSYVGTRYGWRAEFELEKDNSGDDVTYWFAESSTAPHSICLAALKTIEK